MIKKYYKIFILLLIFSGIGVFSLSVNLINSQEPDVVAVRVHPNPDHFSPMRWYQAQGLAGSPQEFEVDGYQALRSGRTVFVNAANITGVCSNDSNTNCSNDIECGEGNTCNLSNFYTNIYVIAHNENATAETGLIFSEMLNRIKFNTNLGDIGHCKVGNIEQGLDNSEYQACNNDRECSEGVFCDSDKAKVTRDTRRLSDMSYIRHLLEQYKFRNGHYPILSSGTYLPHVTMSVWPSWQENLALELGVDSLPVDKINRLGGCSENYVDSSDNTIDLDADPQTCWDEIIKVFADTTPTTTEVTLPENSYVYLYITDPEGRGYNIQ